MVVFVVAWALTSGAYLLFAGQASGDEVVAGVAVGLAAGLWQSTLARNAEAELSAGPGAASTLARAVAGLPAACMRTALALVRSIGSGRGGRLAEQVFGAGGGEEPSQVGRRAVALLAACLAPDSYVVRVDDAGRRLRAHVIAPSRTAAGSASP